MGQALQSSFSLPVKATALVPGVSSGKNPACDPRRFYRVFRDNWPEFLRHNFRNATDAACFFGVDERTARGWFDGLTAPSGQVVAYSIATMPEQSREFLAGAA